ncbi:MAG: iron chelate uptake ABC transporter family permease subunit [Chloroflexi bacterium]|nr:iron chelate uptake ABC transporter family permease subunit [Chloroflexota bacterium]
MLTIRNTAAARLPGLPSVGVSLRPPRGRTTILVGVLLALLAAAVVVSAAHGPARITYLESAAIVLDDVGIHLGVPYPRTAELVIEQVRLPRILTGALVGMSLALAGVALQGLFRNPMADPGILGVSAGGALAAVLAIVTGMQARSVLFLPAMSVIGSLTTVSLVYGLANAGGRFTLASLLLSGMAVSAFLGACISFIMLSQRELASLQAVLFWLAGGLDARLWLHVRLIAPPLLLGAVAVYAFARSLNVMLLGEETAHSLGVRVRRSRLILLALASVLTGVAVSVSGTIGFVGLVVPHAMRLLVGPDHRILLPVSALAGAVFLVTADTVARLVLQPAELRVGIVTAFVGAPFFLFLLLRNRRRLNLL